MKDHLARKAIDELAQKLGYQKPDYYEMIKEVIIGPDNFDKMPVPSEYHDNLVRQINTLLDYLGLKIERCKQQEYKISKKKGR